MSLPQGVRRLLRLHEPQRDVADELGFHFDHAVAELQARGLTEAEARREAERRFGDVVAYRRELEGIDRGRLRAERRTNRLEAVRDVVAHAARSVRRAPALSLAVILTMALGIGANVTVYGIVDRLLLSPPPYVAEPEQVRRVMIEQFQEWRGERNAAEHLAYLDFMDIAGASALAGAAVWQETLLTVGHGVDARRLDGLLVSGSYFELRGAQPARGRLIGPQDDDAAAQPVAVISHELWQREHAGSDDVIGSTVTFGTKTYTVIGIAPPGMTSLRLAQVDVWLPVQHAIAQSTLEARNYHQFGAVARLRADATEVAAMDEMSLRLRQGRAEDIASGRFDADARALLTPLLQARGPLAPPEARVAWWLGGVSLMVLLIACVNVANLLLARMLRQRRETAVRLALGISRARLVGQILLEGVLLGLLGGAAALLLAHWSSTAISSVLLPTVAWERLGWPRELVPLALGVAAYAGLAAALLPALQSTRPALSGTLRESGAGSAPAAARARTALTLAQATLSVILLVGAGLFVRSLDAVRTLDLGFRMDNLYYVQASFTAGSVTPEEASAVRQQLLQRLQSHPGLHDAATASTAPFRWIMSNNVRLPGRDSLPLIGTGDHWVFSVTPGYFELMGMQFVSGRPFDERDVRAGANVGVVNQTMARALWPDGDAVGSCMLVGRDATDCTLVVGIVRDARHSHLREEGAAQYYLPLHAHHGSTIMLVRAAGRGTAVASELRTTVASLDPRIRYVDVTPAAEAFAPQERQWRLGATLFSAFGALALVVAALGLYAVLAFDVLQRTREIGVRSALGATRSGIMRLVAGQALKVAAAGVLLGCAAAAAIAPRLGDMLFGVQPHDPATYGGVAALLMLVALLAAAVPARRAASVDPNVALRGE